MNFNYLYYPSISIPNDSWIRRVLLYSDKIASIVPYDMKNHLNYNLEYLISNNEYRSLSPEEFFGEFENVRNFEDEVKDYFSSEIFKKMLEKESNRNKSLIFESKFTNEIKFFFESMNYYDQVIESEWKETPKIVGDTYLAILAKHMGDFYSYIPTTNSVKNQNLAFKNNNLPREKVGELRLLESLPTPSKDIPIIQIIDFKNKRKQELLKFKEILRENLEKISKIDNEEELSQYIHIFKEKLQIEVNDIKQLLKENKISYSLESLKTLVQLDKDLIVKIATGSLITGVSGSPITGAAIVGTAEVAINLCGIVKDYYIHKNDVIRNSPYSYAFYSNQFIRSSNKRYKSLTSVH